MIQWYYIYNILQPLCIFKTVSKSQKESLHSSNDFPFLHFPLQNIKRIRIYLFANLSFTLYAGVKKQLLSPFIFSLLKKRTLWKHTVSSEVKTLKKMLSGRKSTGSLQAIFQPLQSLKHITRHPACPHVCGTSRQPEW